MRRPSPVRRQRFITTKMYNGKIQVTLPREMPLIERILWVKKELVKEGVSPNIAEKRAINDVGVQDKKRKVLLNIEFRDLQDQLHTFESELKKRK